MFVRLKLQTSKVLSFDWLSMVQPVFISLIVNLDADRLKSQSILLFNTVCFFFLSFECPIANVLGLTTPCEHLLLITRHAGTPTSHQRPHVCFISSSFLFFILLLLLSPLQIITIICSKYMLEWTDLYQYSYGLAQVQCLKLETLQTSMKFLRLLIWLFKLDLILYFRVFDTLL